MILRDHSWFLAQVLLLGFGEAFCCAGIQSIVMATAPCKKGALTLALSHSGARIALDVYSLCFDKSINSSQGISAVPFNLLDIIMTHFPLPLGQNKHPLLFLYFYLL